MFQVLIWLALTSQLTCDFSFNRTDKTQTAQTQGPKFCFHIHISITNKSLTSIHNATENKREIRSINCIMDEIIFIWNIFKNQLWRKTLVKLNMHKNL